MTALSLTEAISVMADISIIFFAICFIPLAWIECRDWFHHRAERRRRLMRP